MQLEKPDTEWAKLNPKKKENERDIYRSGWTKQYRQNFDAMQFIRPAVIPPKIDPESDDKIIQCKACNKFVPWEETCENCGADLPKKKEKIKCPACEKMTPWDDQCKHCGEDLPEHEDEVPYPPRPKNLKEAVAYLDQYMDDDLVVGICLDKIERCVRGSPSQKKELRDISGIPLVVVSMECHPDEISVQKRGCAALWSAAGDDDNREAIAGSCGIDAIVAAMKKFKKDPSLSREACGALLNLSMNAGLDANRIFIMEANAIESVYQVLRNFKEEPKLITRAINCLFQLAVTSECRDRIGETDAIPAVSAAMRRFPDNLELQQAAMGMMKNCANAGHLRPLMEKSRIPEAAQKAQKAFPRDDKISRRADFVLSKF